MNLIAAIRQGRVGQTFELLSNDEGAKRDIPAWIAEAKQELLEVVQDNGYFRIVVRKVR